MAANKKNDPQPSFEQAVLELEEITRALESGSLSLEDSIKAYERGMELRALCLDLLEKAEQKLEIVERNHQGAMERRPFRAAAAGPEASDLFGRAERPDDPPF